MKRTTEYLLNCLLLISMLLSSLVPATAAWAAPAAQEITCAEEYTVQADDWLSKISEKLLGDVLAFPAIAEATNQKHAADATFAEVSDPNLIEVGWKLCIPGVEDAQALLASAPAAPEPAPEAAVAPLEPANLTIFAAASLTEAFNEIGQNFSALHPGVTETFNFAGSQ